MLTSSPDTNFYFRTATAVRLTVVSTPPVVEVRIRRPDTKYQLGFSVQNGVICSLLRGRSTRLTDALNDGRDVVYVNQIQMAHGRIFNPTTPFLSYWFALI